MRARLASDGHTGGGESQAGTRLPSRDPMPHYPRTGAMPLSNPCIENLFRDARSHGAWLDKPVSDETLREIYDALKWGPTSANASPDRLVFIRTAQNKERLR